MGIRTGTINIPPNKSAYGLKAVCGTSVTSKLPPANSINPLTNDYVIFAYALHMHTLGIRMDTVQTRNGEVVKVNGTHPFGQDYFYDYNMVRDWGPY